MRYVFAIVLLSIAARSQSFTASTNSELPSAPLPRQFWTIETKVNVSILAGLVAADGITTQLGLTDGFREANPLMRPFSARGALGQSAGSALGFGAAVAGVYILHRTHHYKAERVAMRLMVASEAGFVVNNIVVLH